MRWSRLWAAWIRAAWINGRWLVDGGDAFPLEQAIGDAVGEAKDLQGDGPEAGGEDLRADALSLLPRDLRILRCCLIQRNSSSIFQRAVVELADFDGGTVETSSVIVSPSWRLTISRRKAVGSLERPLLASLTSLS